MGFIHWANSIVEKFTLVDVFFIELSSLAAGILLAALIPSLIDMNPWWIVAAVLIFALKPLSTAMRKDSP